MSDYKAGGARHAGGRRIARSEPDVEDSVETPTEPIEVQPGAGRRRRPVPADEAGALATDGAEEPLPTSIEPPDMSRRAAHMAPVPVDASPADVRPDDSVAEHVGRSPAWPEERHHTTPEQQLTIAASGPRWPFLDMEHTASQWVAPLIGPEATEPPPVSYNDMRRARWGTAQSQGSTTATSASPAQYPAASRTPLQGPAEPPTPLGEPFALSSATTALATPTDATIAVPKAEPDGQSPPPVDADTASTQASTRTTRQRTPAASQPRRALAILLTLVWLAAVAVSGGRLAAAHDLWSPPDDITRIGSVTATWLAIALLARRCGGRYILIGIFAALVLGLVAAYPENWALAGAGVTAASVYGVLGMTLTRPSSGLRTLRELLISALIGAGGAVVVTGFDVELRPFRFRVMVLTLVLLGGFALAWRLGQGARSLGRRGIVLIGGGVLVLAVSIAYTQAIRAWGSPGVVASVTDVKDTLDARLGAVPRPIEALVGFPALVWGVAIRSRRRQGWWMCAFGGLGAAGVATSLIQPAMPFADSLAATGYDLVIGGVLGLVLVLLDRLLTGGGRRASTAVDGPAERPEPPRFAPLL